MSVRKSTHNLVAGVQIANTVTSSSAGGGRLLRRAVVASTSLMAMSAALGWNSPALAAGTCGAPTGGIANCNLTAYPTGIQYTGPNAIDDLTVNVGSFAGQSAAVTVGGMGVVVDDNSLNPVSENVNVGSNVTISTVHNNDITAYSASSASKASTSIYNAGSLASTYEFGIVAGAGVYHNAGGAASASGKVTVGVVNTGDISVYGRGIYGASAADVYNATDAKASDKLSIVNSGDISTSGAFGVGISGSAMGISQGDAHSYATAVASVTNTGTVKTSGVYAASGMVAQSLAVAEVSGTLATSYATASAASTAANTGSIVTSGTDAVGMAGLSQAVAGTSVAPLYSSAAAVTTLTNAGSIKTTGGPNGGGFGADGIYGFALSTAVGKAGGTGSATVNITNAGSIKTSGDGAEGVGVHSQGIGISLYYATGAGYANVVNAGTIKTAGAAAGGIEIETVGYASSEVAQANAYSEASATNTGSIETKGAGGDGISVKATGEAIGVTGRSTASAYAAANVLNTGSIVTKGDGAFGIYALAGDQSVGFESAPYANSSVTSTGDIKTSGAASLGIAAISSGYSDTRYVYSTTRSNVTNAGSVTTSGAGSVGVYALSQSTTATLATIANAGEGKNYAASTIVNAGTIATSGDGAAGAVAIGKATSYSLYQSRTYANASVTNAGAISTSGSVATGVVAESTALSVNATTYYGSIAKATTTVVNAGSVATTGAGATGIEAVGFAISDGGLTASATSSVSVTNAGSVSVGAASGIGIQGYASAYASAATASASATTTIVNAGSVSATGADGTGVFAAASAATNAGALPGSATVVNAAGGTISASGAGGRAVVVEAAYATVATYAGSTIAGGTGKGAVGVYENGALNVVSNAGTIGSGNDHAIEMNGLAANIISNSGTIVGYVTMHATGPAEQNVFYNYGTWVARGGNSDFKHSAGGGSNLVDESTGTIVVVGNQTFAHLDDFTDVGGLITMTQAASAGLGTRPAYETLTVSGDFTGIGGTLAVDATTDGGMQGDVLKIKGAASGGTYVTPTILGTPGGTTGNGILLVSAHATTGASDFTLKGNAANGDEVAGAFIYDLNFVPGAGTSGDWYLQSGGVYPGVYQFGQVGSSAVLVADSVNISIDDLLNQAQNSLTKSASLDTPVQVASTDNTFVPSPNAPGISGWGRYDESRFNVDPNGSPYADYKLRVDTAQFGMDYDWHNAWNEVLVGGYVAPFHSWSDFSSFGTHIGSSGTAYALYGLWFNGPWEGGVRLNYDPTTAHISDTFIGTNAGFKTNEEGVQAAVSYNDMPLVDWADFTPSGELNYGTVDAVHFTDGVGDLVNVGRTNDFWGKLNGRFSTDVMTAKGLLVQPYVNIGLLYRGDTSTKVDIGPFSNSTNINGWNGDFAVGVNTNLMARLSLSAQVDYLAGSRVDGWTGFLGLRYTP